MALGSNHVTTSSAAHFIPEQWQDEAYAAYQRKLVLANLVTKIPFKGRKGDVIHLPVPTRGNASAKAANTAVTVILESNAEKTITINKHFEYTRMYEDIAEMQALSALRKFYTADAGYALAKQVDQDLHLLGAGLQGGSIAGATNLYELAVLGGDGSTAFSGAANTNTGNGSALTDAGIRKMIQTLEDQDVDMDTVALVLPPVSAGVLRGIARFTEAAFAGDGKTIRTGMIADVYGVPVYTSSNCPWVHVNSVTGTQSVTFSSTAPTTNAYVDVFGHSVDWDTTSPDDTRYRVGLLLSKDAVAHAEQQGIRTQAQYQLEYIGTQVTSDTVYGVGEIRDYAGLAFVVPA
jgi:hypothetical protein